MIEPINIGGALRRGWRLLVVLAIVFAIVAVLIPVSASKHTAVKYKWQNLALVGAQPPEGTSSPGINFETIEFWANNYYTKAQAVAAVGLSGALLKLAPLMSGVATNYSALNPTKSTTATTAPKKVTNNNSQTFLVELNAVGQTPLLSQKLANAYATAVGNAVNKQFAAREAALPKAQQQTSPESGFEIIQPSLLGSAFKVRGSGSSATSSKKVRLLIGLLAGLLIGVLIVLAREVLDKTLHSAARAEANFRYPVLAEIPERPLTEAASGTRLDVVGDPSSPTAEAYRMLRMSVMFERLSPGLAPMDGFSDGTGAWPLIGGEAYKAPEPGSRQIILVVSAGSEETRSVVAANLGAAYGEAGQRVIVTSTGDIGSGYAAGNIRNGTSGLDLFELSAHLQSSSLANVSRLSLQPFVGTSGQLVTRAAEVLEAARGLADVIIVEAPPLLVVHHGEALVHSVDAVLIVGECGTTTTDQARRAGDILRRIGAPVLGVVLTKVRLAAKDLRQAGSGNAVTGGTSGPAPTPSPATEPQLVPDPTQV
jgi:Mrp family chromosome partitioning ATPase